MKTRNIIIIFLVAASLLLVSCSKNVDVPEHDLPEQADLSDTVARHSESFEQTEEKDSDGKIRPGQGKPTVTATTTFVSDMVSRLAKYLVDVELIIPAGEDPHMYEPKPQDLEKLTDSDLVIYHGLHFEGKMVDVLETLGFALVKDFPAEKIGVMDDEGDLIVDPHFWFDIDLYKLAVDNVADYLSALLPDEEANIKSRAKKYQDELDQMLIECKAKIETIPTESRYLITPHDAFNYFSKTFNIPVMAPQGISTDSEVANKDIQNTVDFIVEKQVKAVFAETTTDPARMEKLQEGALAQGFEVKVVQGEGNELFSDSLAPTGQEGDNFIDMFKHNVDLIVENLK